MSDENVITKDVLQHILNGLKHQEHIDRLKTSESIPAIMNWTVDAEKSDPFIVPPDRKSNPWNDKSGKGCVLQ